MGLFRLAERRVEVSDLVEGVLVASAVLVDVAEAVERRRLAVGVDVVAVYGQRGLAVGARGVVLAVPPPRVRQQIGQARRGVGGRLLHGEPVLVEAPPVLKVSRPQARCHTLACQS